VPPGRTFAANCHPEVVTELAQLMTALAPVPQQKKRKEADGGVQAGGRVAVDDETGGKRDDGGDGGTDHGGV
jgi:hypothetical protein